MRLKRTLYSLFAIILLFFGTSMAQRPQSITVTGYIKSYGNMPFNFPIIECVDGKLYEIDTSDDLKKVLLTKQGRLVSLTGIPVDSKKNDDFYYENLNLERILLESFHEIESTTPTQASGY